MPSKPSRPSTPTKKSASPTGSAGKPTGKKSGTDAAGRTLASTSKKGSATKKTAVAKLKAEPVDHRTGKASWGYPKRIGSKWRPNPFDAVKPNKNSLEDMVRSHLSVAAMHAVFSVHPEIVSTGTLAERAGVRHGDVSRVFTGRRNLGETMQENWDRALHPARWQPAAAAVTAELQVAWNEIQAHPARVSALSAKSAGANPRQRISSPRLPNPSRLAQRLSALAAPGLTQALTFAYQSCGGSGTGNPEVVVRIAGARPQSVHIGNTIGGYVHPDEQDTWIRICLSEEWAEGVENGEPTLIDNVFVYAVEDTAPDEPIRVCCRSG